MELGCALMEHVCETKTFSAEEKESGITKKKSPTGRWGRLGDGPALQMSHVMWYSRRLALERCFMSRHGCVLLPWCSSPADAHTGNLLLGARRSVPALWAGEGHCGKSTKPRSRAANEIKVKTKSNISALCLHEILSRFDGLGPQINAGKRSDLTLNASMWTNQTNPQKLHLNVFSMETGNWKQILDNQSDSRWNETAYEGVKKTSYSNVFLFHLCEWPEHLEETFVL